MSPDRSRREYDKFEEVAGETAVRVTGQFDVTPAGLRLHFRTTTMMITDVETALPATPLGSRNAMTITNLSTTDTLYIGESGVTADRVLGTTAGEEVGPNSGFNVDITNEIILYGICETGKSILVKVTELA